MDPKEKPTTKSLRDIINRALDDDRRDKIQLGILDEFFFELSHNLPMAVDQSVRMLFNRVAPIKNDGDKVAEVIRLLTIPPDPMNPMAGGYDPIMNVGIPIQTEFTEYKAGDVQELPGYKKLHEAAREKDIALSLHHLFGDGRIPPYLTVDLTKTYVDGAGDPNGYYPELPPVEVKFDRATPKDHDL